MDGLPTQKDFALGLVAAGTVLPASGWAIGFPPAEANTRAERNAPIAPVVPKAFWRSLRLAH